MSIVSRYLAVTQGNLDNHHFYLTEILDMFPEDVFGGPEESQAAARTVRVQWGNQVVETDIDRTKGLKAPIICTPEELLESKP